MSRPGTIGRDLPGFHTKLDKEAAGVSDISVGAGELCMRGRNVFMGYLGAEERTREVFDRDGWHHSGDVGMRDEDGFFTITGRIKEILITAGGENVPPVIIEDMVSSWQRGAADTLRDQTQFFFSLNTMQQFTVYQQKVLAEDNQTVNIVNHFR